jgi:hypothetical protein
MYAVKLNDSNQNALLPDQFLLEFYQITNTRPLRQGYEEVTNAVFKNLQKDQDKLLKDFDDEKKLKHDEKEAEKEIKRQEKQAKKDAIKTLDLSSFTQDQQTALLDLIDYVLEMT